MIERGDIKPGDRIYSESELCEKFGISRITVRRAIEDLAREGYLQKVPGKGTFVSKSKIVEKLGHLVTFTEDMLSRGLKPGSKLLRRSLVEANSQIAKHLRLTEENSRVIFVEQLLFADDQPICLRKVFLPFNLFKDFLGTSVAELEEKDLCYILNTFISKPVVWARQTLESVLIEKEEAALLKVPEGFPGLFCTRITFDETDSPIEYVEFLYRADRYKFVVNLVRPGFSKNHHLSSNNVVY
jgi:GntR family transcriptional regulator